MESRNQPREGETRTLGADSKKSSQRQDVKQNLEEIARQYNNEGEADYYKGNTVGLN